MQSVASRRTFVRQMAVGLPAVAGAVGALGGGLGAAAPQHGMPGATDPQIESVLRDLARIHNQLRQRPLTASDLRAIGVQLRTLATYQRQAHRDTAFLDTARDGVARFGIGAVVDHRPDMEAMRQELVAFGFVNPEITSVPAGRDERSEALDRLLRQGITPMYDEIAAMLDNEAIADQLANGSSTCDVLVRLTKQMDVAAALLCTMAAILPVLAPDCFAATTVLAGLKLLQYLHGC